MLTRNTARYARKLGNPPKVMTVLESTSGSSCSADFLRRIGLIFHDTAYLALFFDDIGEGYLRQLMTGLPVSTEMLEVIYEQRLLPTPAVLELIENGIPKKEKMTKISEAKRRIQEGRFDASNPLHIELEYSRYRTGEFISPHDFGKLDLDTFRKIQYIEGRDVAFFPEDLETVENTAAEAVAVFKLARSKKSEVPLLVIANERYGSLFVVDPIEDLYRAEGIFVAHECIRSIHFDLIGNPADITKYGTISDGTWELIARDNPNVLVVDGTVYSNFGEGTRFPAAMLGYINAFLIYNRVCDSAMPDQPLAKKLKSLGAARPYSINFWSPLLKDRIFVGKHEYFPVKEGERELTIVNPVYNSDARFDDPEEYIKGPRLGFNSKGLCYTCVSKRTDKFVRHVQGLIREKALQLA
jgi:hypothetical protein